MFEQARYKIFDCNGIPQSVKLAAVGTGQDHQDELTALDTFKPPDRECR